jgi:hypothetical protein
VATYLDVLVELLTDPGGRAAYLRDPGLWLQDAGLGYLCGEDVVAAGPMVTTWFPELTEAFAALEGFEPEPGLGETELAAAIRTIAVLIERVPLDALVDLLVEEPEAVPEVGSFG